MIRPFIASSPSQVYRDHTAEPDDVVAAAEVPMVAAKGHCRGEDQGRAEGEADSARPAQRRRASNSSATLLSLSSSASASMLAKSSTPMSPYAFCTRWPHSPMSFTLGTMRVDKRVRNWRI